MPFWGCLLMSIKVKMSLILAPLIIAVIAFSVLLLVDDRQAINNAERILSASRFLERANASLHELQKERGSSAGWLAGDKNFRQTVDNQRPQTDMALEAFATLMAGPDGQQASANLKKLYAEFLDLLKARKDWHQRIDAGNAEPAAAISYYSTLNAILLKVLPNIAEDNTDATLSPSLMAFHQFLEMKERAGIERAVVSAALGAREITDTILMRVASLRDSQAQYLTQFRLYAPKAIAAEIDPLLNQEVMAAVESVRTQVLSRNPQTPAATWFRQATERINLLKRGEDLISQAIRVQVESVRAATSEHLTRSVLVTISLLAVIALVAGFFVMSMSRVENGLIQLSRIMGQAAQDRDLSLRVHQRGQDEVGQVASAFNRMMTDFSQLIEHIREVSTQLATAAEETATTTSVSARELQSQLTETLSVTAAIEEMSVSIQEVSRQVRSVSQAVQEVQSESLSAETAVGASVEDTRLLSDEITRINEGILQLSTSSERITEVVSVIRTIAGQTNLLALNAAIEAARAGEAGRGFAVVADEVRALAQRTQDSTVEIEEMVTVLQNSVGSASAMIGSSQQMAARSVDLSGRVSGSLHSIFDAIEKIQSLMAQIATTAQQQAGASSEVAKSAAGIGGSAEAAVEHSQQIARVSEEVSHLASQLNQAAGAFKVRG